MKIHRSRTTANAVVARARYTPESRSAGSAISAPSTAETPTATTRAHGCPSAPRWPQTTAPIPAMLSWHSETWPAYPVSGTYDNAIRPSEKIGP